MKTITIITEQMTERELAAAVPTHGVASVRFSRTRGVPLPVDETYQSFGDTTGFRPRCRIDLLVEDHAAATVFDCVEFAYGAGFFGDAALWIDASPLAA